MQVTKRPADSPVRVSRALPASGQLLRGVGWAALALVILSGWFVVTRLSVTRELRTWDILALRFGVGALVLLPILLIQRRQLSTRVWLEGLLLASLWGAPFVLFVALGLQLTSASQASSVTPGLMPVLAGLLAWAIYGEHPSRAKLWGYAVIVSGVAGLLWAQAIPSSRSGPLGLASLLVASALWAAYTLRLRRGLLTPPQAAAFVCVWSAVLYIPVYYFSGLSRLGQAPLQEVASQAVYQGVLMSAVAMLAFNRAVALLGAVSASAVVGLVPVVATILAVPVLGEVPTALAAFAIGAIAVGVMLASRSTPSPVHTAIEDVA